jgi:Mg-chelatase subunit ChlD
VNYQKGGTDMTAGINACKNLLATHPLMSGTRRSKVLVLLTDGGPDNPETTSAAAAAAKASGITLITVGVGSANLAYMDSLSSGAGYAYSAAYSDATNLRVQITPALCSAGEVGCGRSVCGGAVRSN